MTLVRQSGGGVILASFIVAMLLTLLPLPHWAEFARPEWVAMVLIYWCMALPHRIGVGMAWGAGLLLDVLRGAVLGQYAMALTVVAFLTLKLHQRVRVYPLWQQALTVLLLVVLMQMLVLWLKGIMGQSPTLWLHLLPSLTSMLLWPWLFVVMRNVRRRFRVA